MLRHSQIALLVAFGCASTANAQGTSLSPVPMQAVYEYQLNYQLPWQRWYGGPGLSLGGTMPTRGVFGYSSLNGLPLPAPMGAGVYVNGPAPNAVGMPTPPPVGAWPIRAPGIATPGLPMVSGLGMSSPAAMMMGGMPSPAAMMGGAGPPDPSRGGFPSSAIDQVRSRRRQAPESTPSAKRMSVEQQNLGDAKLRNQQWSKAYVNYRNAADAAPERAEAHFRLGMAFAAMKQYSSAIREFKRSLDLDPTLPQSGDKLSTIFGEDSNVVKTAIVPDVADWANDDLADSDRLFLLGLLLDFDDDPRGSEILEAALKSSGPNQYIMAFFDSTPQRDPSSGRSHRRGRSTSPSDDQDKSSTPDKGAPSPSSDDAVPPSPATFDAPPAGLTPNPPPT